MSVAGQRGKVAAETRATPPCPARGTTPSVPWATAAGAGPCPGHPPGGCTGDRGTSGG